MEGAVHHDERWSQVLDQRAFSMARGRCGAGWKGRGAKEGNTPGAGGSSGGGGAPRTPSCGFFTSSSSSSSAVVSDIEDSEDVNCQRMGRWTMVGSGSSVPKVDEGLPSVSEMRSKLQHCPQSSHSGPEDVWSIRAPRNEYGSWTMTTRQPHVGAAGITSAGPLDARASAGEPERASERSPTEEEREMLLWLGEADRFSSWETLRDRRPAPGQERARGAWKWRIGSYVASDLTEGSSLIKVSASTTVEVASIEIDTAGTKGSSSLSRDLTIQPRDERRPKAVTEEGM